MISNFTKMRVAQNCSSYKPRYAVCAMSVSTLSESCSNCQNYENEKCSKGLFNGIMESINMN